MNFENHRLSPSFDLSNVDTWVFDIDNTLYPAECDLFTQIHALMAQYVANITGTDIERAKLIRRDFYVRYGTTMRGLMEEHGVDPNDYMAFVHDVDYSAIKPSAFLRETLQNLPGRILAFTNASLEHGERCAKNLDVHDLFDGWFDIRDANFEPKPHAHSYQMFSERFAIQPERTIFFEDSILNLETAKHLGWQTVYIDPAVAKAAHADDLRFSQVGYVDAASSGLETFFRADWS